ncbi:MAG: 30S ribosomal protein S4 [Thermoguttaceae bacterium]
MARNTGPVCKKCRREGTKLFLKGTRCDTDKCALSRRQTPPGMHGMKRGKLTDYAIHLREKQKVKTHYGVLEKQFRKYFQMAERMQGNTGTMLMSLLERRLDNIVYRLGFGLSRSQSRQWISHGHILVNGRRVDIPSLLVRPGDEITIKNRPVSLKVIKACIDENYQRDVPDFLVRSDDNIPKGYMLRLPSREDVSLPVEPALIVELCSK